MIRHILSPAVLLLAACSATPMAEPSLAPRPAEAIDPRVPVDSPTVEGPVDSALAAQLATLVGAARAAEPEFARRAAQTERLVAVAGPQASESWVAAQIALSQLVAAQGKATQAAADVDGLFAQRVKAARWIAPADRSAIAAAQNEIASITARQATTVDSLRDRLAR